MGYRIADLEEETGMSLEDAVSDYVDSCLRTGLTDKQDIADSFCDECEIVDRDRGDVLIAVEKELGKYDN